MIYDSLFKILQYDTCFCAQVHPTVRTLLIYPAEVGIGKIIDTGIDNAETRSM